MIKVDEVRRILPTLDPEHFPNGSSIMATVQHIWFPARCCGRRAEGVAPTSALVNEGWAHLNAMVAQSLYRRFLPCRDRRHHAYSIAACKGAQQMKRPQVPARVERPWQLAGDGQNRAAPIIRGR